MTGWPFYLGNDMGATLRETIDSITSQTYLECLRMCRHDYIGSATVLQEFPGGFYTKDTAMHPVDRKANNNMIEARLPGNADIVVYEYAGQLYFSVDSEQVRKVRPGDHFIMTDKSSWTIHYCIEEVYDSNIINGLFKIVYPMDIRAITDGIVTVLMTKADAETMTQEEQDRLTASADGVPIEG